MHLFLQKINSKTYGLISLRTIFLLFLLKAEETFLQHYSYEVEISWNARASLVYLSVSENFVSNEMLVQKHINHFFNFQEISQAVFIKTGLCTTEI